MYVMAIIIYKVNINRSKLNTDYRSLNTFKWTTYRTSKDHIVVPHVDLLH